MISLCSKFVLAPHLLKEKIQILTFFCHSNFMSTSSSDQTWDELSFESLTFIAFAFIYTMSLLRMSFLQFDVSSSNLRPTFFHSDLYFFWCAVK